MHFSNYAQTGIINMLFRNGNFVKPGTLAIGLSSGVPTNASDGGEISASDYTRYLIGGPNNIHFNPATISVSTSGVTANSSGLTWAAATSYEAMAESTTCCDTKPWSRSDFCRFIFASAFLAFATAWL